MTGGTYFTGGNGVGIAFEACGICDVFGVEYDDKIAQVARDNGFPVTTADVRDIDPASLPRVDWFHASPVCKNASTAKADGEESPEDLETAQAVERYIDHHKPRIFSLENVWGYREFQAFQDILKCLTRNGYAYEYWHLNSADYGVPQTRKRLILVARNDGIKPRKPLPTHTENPAPMFDERKKWIGWYEAIEDLIPTLPPSQFAKWQLERLPKEITQTVLLNRNTTERDDYFREYQEPSYVVTSDGDNGRRRAFLMQVQGAGGDGIKEQTEPMQTVTENHSANKYRAFITAGGDAWSPVLDDTAPLFTLSSSKDEHATRAFLVDGTGNDHMTKVTARQGDEPHPSITSSYHNKIPRAQLSGGRVVKMTPRALARFQSFPDDYKLSGRAALDCKIIGNAVPPLLMQRVIEAQND